jgi:hypothetical protein
VSNALGSVVKPDVAKSKKNVKTESPNTSQNQVSTPVSDTVKLKIPLKISFMLDDSLSVFRVDKEIFRLAAGSSTKLADYKKKFTYFKSKWYCQELVSDVWSDFKVSSEFNSVEQSSFEKFGFVVEDNDYPDSQVSVFYN